MNNEWVTNEIKMENLKKNTELGKNEDTIVNTIIRGKIIDLSAYISKRYINNPPKSNIIIQLRALKKLANETKNHYT